MSHQPTNEECADMFRVMIGEMMRMHPHYQVLRRCIRDLIRDIEAGTIKKKEMSYRLHELKNLFGSFDD